FEELFFRGFLFSALRGRTGPVTTVLVSAALFGLFHSFSFLGQVVTSALLGVVLGWVCWQTGSVLPGMIIHACHNSLVFLASKYQVEIRQRGWFDLNAAHLPAAWLACALVGVALGTALLWWGSVSRAATVPEDIPVSV